MVVEGRRQLSTVVRVRVHRDVCMLPCLAREELDLGQHGRDGSGDGRTESPKLSTLPSLTFRLTCALATSMPPMTWRA